MLQLEIVTPSQTSTHEAEEIRLHTPGGDLGIRRGHMDLVTVALPGEIGLLTKKGAVDHLTTAGGTVMVTHTLVRLLTASVTE